MGGIATLPDRRQTAHGRPAGHRLLVAILVAVVVGGAVAVAAGTVFDGAGRLTVGGRGVVDGVEAGAVSFGLTLVAGGSRRQRRIGAAVLAGRRALGAWFFPTVMAGMRCRCCQRSL